MVATNNLYHFPIVVLVSSFATFSANVKCAIISKETNAVETVNNIVNDLVNQTAIILAISKSNDTNAVANQTFSTTIGTTVDSKVSEETRKQQKGFLNFWAHESTTTTTKEPPDADSQNEDVSEDEESASAETETMIEQRNDSAVSAADAGLSHNAPNFHFSIKIGRNEDATNSQNLMLQAHLNRTIEKLREFNDKYEYLIDENESIKKDLQKLKDNAGTLYKDVNLLKQTSLQADDDVTKSTSEATTTIKLNDLMKGIRVNLMA